MNGNWFERQSWEPEQGLRFTTAKEGGNLFIDTECARCVSVMERREAKGETFVNLDERRRVARESAEYQAFLAEQAAIPENSDSAWPFQTAARSTTADDKVEEA